MLLMEWIVIDRKEYMWSSYSKYWKNARKYVDGFMEYDKAFITLIDNFSKKLEKIYRFHIFENRTAIRMLYKTIKKSVKFILQKGHKIGLSLFHKHLLIQLQYTIC